MHFDPVWILFSSLVHRRLSSRRVINRVTPLCGDLSENLCLLLNLVNHWFGAIGFRKLFQLISGAKHQPPQRQHFRPSVF